MAGKYDHIDFVPPKSVAESIELAHELDRLNRPDLANILDSFDES